jgi:5-(carboxyamino)imidazole ribonucleotide mutase
VATFAIGVAGAKNAALFAAAVLSSEIPSVAKNLLAFRKNQTEEVLAISLD